MSEIANAVSVNTATFALNNFLSESYPLLDWKSYVSHNPDLQHITTREAAEEHWEKYGKNEGRLFYGVNQLRLDWITAFLNTEGEEQYNNMLLSFRNPVIPPGFRFLITLADGTTAYDSSRGLPPNPFDEPGRNTYSNIRKILVNTTNNTASYAINENHNSRPEFLLALAAQDGRGFSARYSTSVNAYGYNSVLRIGPAQSIAVGCARGSIVL